ncbi:hypothetical protein [Streptomyces sp. 4N124]|uniref:hypothetical protein n=1 Tax=Streptomyces sp. 4N124 TaxID=3457420 RepID=UPI003FD2EC8C
MQRDTSHRKAIRRLLTGTAVAVAGTAAMVAVTVPMNASGDDGTPSPAITARATATPTPYDSPETPGQPAPAAAPLATGTGNDALTDAEIERAGQLALGADRQLRATSEDVRGRDGKPQLLTTTLVDPDGTDAERRADILFYDYRDDRLVKKTVNLTTGRVERAQSTTGSQPPPAGPESREALKVLLTDPLGQGVRQDYESATGRPLTSDRQLRVQGMTYDTPPPDGTELADCDGTHRCVRLFTSVRNGPWIDTLKFVIDLSDRSVHRLP